MVTSTMGVVPFRRQLSICMISCRGALSRSGLRGKALLAMCLRAIGLLMTTSSVAAASVGPPTCSLSQAFPIPLEPSGDTVSFVVCGDLNGDGVDDAVASWIHVARTIFCRRDGSVDLGPELDLVFGITGLALADMNQDGALDLVAGTSGPVPTVHVLLNDGAGVLSVAHSIAVEGSFSSSPSVADVDLDGAVDVLVGTKTSSTEGTILRLAGDGQGGLQDPVAVFPLLVTRLGTTDLDGDGRPDIVATSAAELHVLNGLGDGEFSPPTSTPAPGPVNQLLLGDLNGDGRGDIVLTDSMLWTLLTDERGNIGAAVAGPIGQPNQAASLGDIDGDGDLDIFGTLQSECVSGAESHCAQLLVNDGSGSFAAPEAFLVGRDPRVIRAGHFDGDAFPDLLCFQDSQSFGGNSTKWIAVVRGGPDGHLQTPETINIAVDASCVAAGDLDEDGDLDVVSGGLGASARVYLNDGAGNLGSPTTVAMGSGADLRDMLLVDLNNDGILDLAVTRDPYSPSSPLGAAVRLGIGGGQFGAAQVVDCGGDGRGLAAGDLDGDGDVDLAISKGAPSGIALLINDGQGGFSLLTQILINAQVGDVAIVDLDGNAHPELLVASYSSPELLRFDDVGAVTEPTAQVISLPGSGGECFLTPGDVDGDGDIDIVAMRCDQSQGTLCTLTSFLNDGNGVLVASPPSTIAARGGSSLRLADVTGDGRLDAVTSHAFMSGFGLLVGRGDGTFDAVGTFGGWGARRTELGDIDADGDLDAIVAGSRLQIARSSVSEMQPADLTCDGVVDGTDLGEMLSLWGACPGCSADLDGDGQVGASDLALLIGNWSR